MQIPGEVFGRVSMQMAGEVAQGFGAGLVRFQRFRCTL